jgi:hypothetical protein
MRRPTRPDRFVHQFGKDRISGLFLHASLESQIGLLSLFLRATPPVGHVVQKTTFLPKLGLFEGAIYEHTASVTGKVCKLELGVKILSLPTSEREKQNKQEHTSPHRGKGETLGFILGSCHRMGHGTIKSRIIQSKNSKEEHRSAWL